jgi:hypothetical protein
MFPGLPQVSIFMTNRSVPLPEVLDTVWCTVPPQLHHLLCIPSGLPEHAVCSHMTAPCSTLMHTG